MLYSEIVKNFAPDIKFSRDCFTIGCPGTYIKHPENDIYRNRFYDFSESNYSIPQEPIAITEMGNPFGEKDVYILRMPICYEYEWKLPVDLLFLRDFISCTYGYQSGQLGTFPYPYVYLTVRHGPQLDKLVDVWHVDGFQGSPAERHIPEISYIWTSDPGTEWAKQGFDIPPTFDPTKHNFFKVIEGQVKEESIIKSEPNKIYLFNPYMVHRKPKCDGNRSMVRLTFSPVEIKDPNYTPNPHFDLKYNKPEPRDELL